MRAPLSDRGAMLGSGLGVSQCALQSGPREVQRLQRGLRFDGINNQANLPNIATPNAGTYSLWVKPTRWDAGVGGLVDSNFDIFLYPNLLYFRAGNQFSVSTLGLPRSAWNHLAMPWNGSVFTGFVNGSAVGSGVQTGFRAGPLFLGIVDGNPSFRFDGSLARMRLYNRALPAYEIAEHARGIFSNNDGLVGRWDLDEPDGLIAYDKSGYGNHGTLVGNPQRVQVFRPDRLP